MILTVQVDPTAGASFRVDSGKPPKGSRPLRSRVNKRRRAGSRARARARSERAGRADRTIGGERSAAAGPRLDASKIEVTIDRGVLRIAGARAPSGPPEGRPGKFYTRERGAGEFARAIALPDDVDPSHVKANYQSGVLQISVARSAAAQPTRINVE